MQLSLPTPEGAGRLRYLKLFADLDAPLTAAVIDALQRLKRRTVDARHQVLFVREVGACQNHGPVSACVGPTHTGVDQAV